MAADGWLNRRRRFRRSFCGGGAVVRCDDRFVPTLKALWPPTEIDLNICRSNAFVRVRMLGLRVCVFLWRLNYFHLTAIKCLMFAHVSRGVHTRTRAHIPAFAAPSVMLPRDPPTMCVCACRSGKLRADTRARTHTHTHVHAVKLGTALTSVFASTSDTATPATPH